MTLFMGADLVACCSARNMLFARVAASASSFARAPAPRPLVDPLLQVLVLVPQRVRAPAVGPRAQAGDAGHRQADEPPGLVNQGCCVKASVVKFCTQSPSSFAAVTSKR